MTSSEQRFQILCLSGGGFLGLYTASVLRQLEDDAGCPIGQCFDLIAGTSVGGIIALGLAAHTTAAEIELAFKKNGELIFSSKSPSKSESVRKRATFLRLAMFYNRPIYRSGPLLDTIRQIIPQSMTIGELSTRVMIPAVNLSKGKPQVFKTPHHHTFRRDLHLRVEDVALATSAAPSFFPTHSIDGEVFADGGLYANSPDQLALHEAMHFLGCNVANVHVLSIGTTSTNFSWSSSTKSNLGWLDWAKDQRLLRAMMAAQQINTDYVTRHQLGDRYIRIDANPSSEQSVQLGLDIASETAKLDLLALANASVRAEISKQPLQEMLKHRAPNPGFYRT